MNPNRIISLLFSLLLVPSLVLGQATKEEKEVKEHELSLQEAQNYALEHSHDIKIAHHEIKKAKKDVQATTAIGLPQLEAKGNFQHFLDRPVNLIPAEFFGGPPGTFAEVKFGTEYNATYEFQGSQLIFDGSYFVGLKASKTYKHLSKKRLEKTELEIQDRVAEAYHNVLVAKENWRIFRKTLMNMRELFDETRTMYETGLTEEQEVDQLELTVLNMENSVKRAERQVKVSKKLLKMNMGMPLMDSLTLKDSLKGLFESGANSELIAEEFHPEEHIDHQIKATQVQMKDLAYQKEKVQFLPKINGFFNYQENAQRDEFNFLDPDEEWYPTTLWGISVSIPVFNSGKKLFEAQKAKVDLLQAQEEQRKVKKQLRVRVANARTRYMNAMESLANEKKGLNLARDILKKTMVKHREGMASSLEVTQTQNQFLENQGSYIRAVYELLNARSELRKALNHY